MARRGLSLLSHLLLLLSCDRLLRTLTRTRIGLGTLTTDWQATTVAQTLVATDFNLATNVSLNLTAEVNLYLPGSFNCVTKSRHLVIIQDNGTLSRRKACRYTLI